MIHCYFAFLWKELTFQLDTNLSSLLEGGDTETLAFVQGFCIIYLLGGHAITVKGSTKSLIQLVGWSCASAVAGSRHLSSEPDMDS